MHPNNYLLMMPPFFGRRSAADRAAFPTRRGGRAAAAPIWGGLASPPQTSWSSASLGQALPVSTLSDGWPGCKQQSQP